MQEFENRVAIVTGSSEGIGFAIAKYLIERGATTFINGRNQEKLDKATRILKANSNMPVESFCGDVTVYENCLLFAGKVCQQYGKTDILVNNVGGGTEIRHLENITPADWDFTLNFNLGGAFNMIKAVTPIMREKKYGRIVNISSVAGRNKGRLSGPQYASAKAGLLGLTRHLAWDLAAEGITVNAVAPGFVRTDRAISKWNERSKEEKERMLSGVPMNRFGEPEEIAHAVAFLASEKASYITGVSLDVNGGSFMS